jgi:adenylate cyclase
VSSDADRLHLVADLSARVGRCDDLDHVITACLDGLAELFGFDHSILLVLDEASGRLLTVASHGYAEAGIGSEVGVGIGQGFLGLAAVEQRVVRIGSLGRLLQYGRAAQRQDAELTGATIPDVALPGLPGVQSQIAAPVMRTGELLGVVAIESSRVAAFDADDEAVLEVVAQMLAGAIDDERAAPDDDSSPRGVAHPAVPTSSSLSEAVVRFYPADGSTFLDGDYLVKGVPGRILWKLLREWRDEGRTAFTNREVRLDPALELPPFKDNFESRLILLKRRLDERETPVRIETIGRGRFALQVTSPVVLELRDDPSP